MGWIEDLERFSRELAEMEIEHGEPYVEDPWKLHKNKNFWRLQKFEGAREIIFLAPFSSEKASYRTPDNLPGYASRWNETRKAYDHCMLRIDRHQSRVIVTEYRIVPFRFLPYIRSKGGPRWPPSFLGFRRLQRIRKLDDLSRLEIIDDERSSLYWTGWRSLDGSFFHSTLEMNLSDWDYVPWDGYESTLDYDYTDWSTTQKREARVLCKKKKK